MEHLEQLRTTALAALPSGPPEPNAAPADCVTPIHLGAGATVTSPSSTSGDGAGKTTSTPGGVVTSVSSGQLSSLSSSPEPQSSRYLPAHFSSTDRAIYVPGKYNPSSCLSDAEEDEIYGYTGVDGQPQLPSYSLSQGYLNPRSQFIYELPPVAGRAGGKRRLGLSRLIKTLRRDLKKAAPGRLKGASLSHSAATASARAAVCRASGGDGGTSSRALPVMVLPGHYHHQHQSSSSSSTTTTTTLPPPQHQHQHSNTTNTTSLPATDSTSSSPRGSQHSSRSSGAQSTATAQSNAPLHAAAAAAGGPLLPSGCVWVRAPAAPPHTAPNTPASTTPRDSGLQLAIERLKEQEVLRRRQDQLMEHEQVSSSFVASQQLSLLPSSSLPGFLLSCLD
ncbi:hypothetical protein FHG87_003106 [Trinorchestia longiramus]|nr:hypothetical protein FHG87_003106 [Trinorchestia longiramus]